MKQLTYICFFIATSLFLFNGCKKDNLKEPESILTGNVVYQGQPMGVRSLGVQFEIWQSGYQLYTKIPLNIKQDGTFSAVLFDGDYKLVRTASVGPWENNPDTINVSVKGSSSVDIPVNPYFLITNASVTKNGSTVSATFTIVKNTASKTLELARLYIGPNLILDQNNNSANVQAAATAITVGQPVTLNATIPASLAGNDYLFARIGVKTSGVAELLYTQPQKIQLK